MDDKTVIDAHGDVEGKLKGKDVHVLGRFRGEVEATGRFVTGEGSKVDAAHRGRHGGNRRAS